MFLSVVSRTSKPSASAATINSPFTNPSHPRSIASTTVWFLNACRSGAGVPLSKSMRIDYSGGRRCWRPVETTRSELDYSNHLFTRQMEPFHNLVDRGAHFQIVKHN